MKVAVLADTHAPRYGKACPPEVARRLDGVATAMVHDAGPAAGRPLRLRRRFPGAGLVVFGHSHIPLDLVEDGVRLFNPGRRPIAASRGGRWACSGSRAAGCSRRGSSR